MDENTLKTVEAIFWSGSGEDENRWRKVVDILKAMPTEQARRLMKEARTKAEEQQTLYGMKEGTSRKDIEGNLKRIRDIAKLTMSWIT